MRKLNQSSINKITHIPHNHHISKVIKTEQLEVKSQFSQTGVKDFRITDSTDLLNEFIFKLCKDIHNAKDLYMQEEYNKIYDFVGLKEKEKKEVSKKEESISASMTSQVSESQLSIKDSSVDQKLDENNENNNNKEKNKYDEPLDPVLLKPLKIMHRIINQNI